MKKALAFWMFGSIGVVCIIILFFKLKETKKGNSSVLVDEFEGVKNSRVHPDEHVFPSDTEHTNFFD